MTRKTSSKSSSTRTGSLSLRTYATTTVTYSWMEYSGAPAPAILTTLSNAMTSWTTRLPMVLALEHGYDRPSWWLHGTDAALEAGQEVQPLLMLKDNWDRCQCEGGASSARCGQLDQFGEEIREDVSCPIASPYYRYDWRVGRELSEAQADRWALHHGNPTAHHLFPNDDKGGTNSVDGVPLPEAVRDIAPGGIITAGDRDGLLGQLSPGTLVVGYNFERARLDAINTNEFTVNDAAIIYAEWAEWAIGGGRLGSGDDRSGPTEQGPTA